MRLIDIRNQQIYEDKIKGASTESLSQKYNLSRGTIRNIIHSEKVKRSAPKDNLSDDERELKTMLYKLELGKGACGELFKHLRMNGVNSIGKLKETSSHDVLMMRGIGRSMTDALIKENLIK